MIDLINHKAQALPPALPPAPRASPQPTNNDLALPAALRQALHQCTVRRSAKPFRSQKRADFQQTSLLVVLHRSSTASSALAYLHLIFLHLLLPLPSLFYLPSSITPSHHHRHTITDTSSSTQDHASKHGTHSKSQVTIHPPNCEAVAAAAAAAVTEPGETTRTTLGKSNWKNDSEYRRLINTCLHRLPPRKAVPWPAKNIFAFLPQVISAIHDFAGFGPRGFAASWCQWRLSDTIREWPKTTLAEQLQRAFAVPDNFK
jgi:hypothetical protein